MTNNQSEDIAAIAAGIVDVTEADQEMAAKYYASRPLGHSQLKEMMEIIRRAGEGDVDTLSYLFARHRCNSLRAHLNKTDGEKG